MKLIYKISVKLQFSNKLKKISVLIMNNNKLYFKMKKKF